jgi:DNA repair exonuclease SbcCD ATPase subunit
MSRATSPAERGRQRTTETLRALEQLQSASGHEYTIVKLSEPISSALPPAQNTTNNNNDPSSTNTNLPRTSDVSTSSLDAPTPSSLEADLAHYRELFSKLRFSYVEQVTKEKFIRAIVGDPPLIVSPQENADLEASNAAAKAELKALKTEVAGMVEELERRGRELAGRYETVQAEMRLVRELPGKIATLEKRVAELKAAQQLAPDAKPEMNLPLGKTLALVEGKRRELAGVERQLELLGGQVPRKRKEVERLRGEVAALENRRANSAAAAREAKRRRENAQSGVEDELEARGRWYRASETVLRRVLDLQG